MQKKHPRRRRPAIRRIRFEKILGKKSGRKRNAQSDLIAHDD